MRVSITYLYTIFRYGYPHSVDDAMRSIAEIRKLGFRYLEMEGLGAAFLKALYKRRNELVSITSGSGVHVHNFCVVDPELVSLNEQKQNRALDRFRMGAELAAMLDAGTLHLASYAPPVEYLTGKPYQLGADEGYQFSNGSRIKIPANFDWNLVWAALVRSCQRCADIGREHGKTVIMEPRVGEIICSVDSMLRLIDDVNRPNFKANSDTGHFSAQRENVVLALAKLRGRFANIHIADNNPINTNHVAVGDGVIDWTEFFGVLKRMHYDGYLGLDLGMSRSLVRDYRKSVERIQAIASGLKLKIEV
jgi:sugar phosphate isomerase/epimerase